jgi:hypothetical protein
MAKKPLPPANRRGRPPKPGGPTPQADIQRAYRARLAEAGRVVRLVDAYPAGAFDREARQAFEDIREKPNNALSELERREQDVGRLEARNAYLESELKRVEQHNTNVLKEVITLRQELAKQR